MQFYKVTFVYTGDKVGRSVRVFAETPGDALIEALGAIKHLKADTHTMKTVAKMYVRLVPHDEVRSREEG